MNARSILHKIVRNHTIIRGISTHLLRGACHARFNRARIFLAKAECQQPSSGQPPMKHADPRVRSYDMECGNGKAAKQSTIGLDGTKYLFGTD
jgi:hypothetical protein